MANITESTTYEPAVFLIAEDTPVVGGEPLFDVGGQPTTGYSNAQGQQLANRTAYLKVQVDSIPTTVQTSVDTAIADLQAEADPFAQYVLESTIAAVNGVCDLDASAQVPLARLGNVPAAPTPTWGGIAGTLSDQTDLQTAINAKEFVLTAGTNVTIDRTDPNNPIVNASITGGGGGDVVGPASSVNNEVVLFDGITGKLIKGGGALGSAAFTPTTDYATAAQGALADSALQSETDPVFSASPSFAITGTQITNWDTAYGWGNHATAGYQDALVSGTNIKTINTQSLLGSGDLEIGGIAYTYVTTAVSITANNHEWVRVTAAGQTIGLPENPVAGWQVVISVGNFTDTLVDGALETITGRADDATINQSYSTVVFHYDGTTWRYN